MKAKYIRIAAIFEYIFAGIYAVITALFYSVSDNLYWLFLALMIVSLVIGLYSESIKYRLDKENKLNKSLFIDKNLETIKTKEEITEISNSINKELFETNIKTQNVSSYKNKELDNKNNPDDTKNSENTHTIAQSHTIPQEQIQIENTISKHMNEFKKDLNDNVNISSEEQIHKNNTNEDGQSIHEKITDYPLYHALKICQENTANFLKKRQAVKACRLSFYAYESKFKVLYSFVPSSRRTASTQPAQNPLSFQLHAAISIVILCPAYFIKNAYCPAPEQ